jgi:hypothetical protein
VRIEAEYSNRNLALLFNKNIMIKGNPKMLIIMTDGIASNLTNATSKVGTSLSS